MFLVPRASQILPLSSCGLNTALVDASFSKMGRIICIGLSISLLVILSVCQSEFDVGVGDQQPTTFGQKVDEEKVKVLSIMLNFFTPEYYHLENF